MKTLIIAIVTLAMLTPSLLAQALPTQTSNVFSGSGNCETCHAPGSPNTAALLDAKGRDVSPVNLWRSTMMANAAKDPFWQAKVTAEVAANPHLQSVIEDKCTTCHAPLGRVEALYNGASAYTFAEMLADPLAMDGVSCTACHQIKSDNLGQSSSFSGHYIIQNDRLIYGPFKNPNTNAMQNQVNYTPVYGSQTLQSELCATCHTLFTPYVDNNGNVVGEAPEQTPYLEWKNSVYPKQNIECQTCHMPVLKESVIIANRPSTLAARSGFANHYFVGGNVYMLKILKKYGTELGVSATATHLDSTYQRTLRMLRQNTVDLSADYTWMNGDTLQIKVAVKNKTGHKFPTAYPSRRAWLYVKLADEQGNVLFESGAWDAQTGDIRGLDEPYEVHHDVINDANQVQVYQSVMKDVDGKVNYTLLRAAGFIKDNRIPPEGFTPDGPAYDSTAVEGLALNDANFNANGSGCDTVTYKIGGIDKNTNYQLVVKMNYQSLSPRFVQDLFTYDTPEVNRFKTYYQSVPNLPVTIDSLQLNVVATTLKDRESLMPQSPLIVKTYPNPFNPQVTVEVYSLQSGRLTVNVFNLLGEKVATLFSGAVNKGKKQFAWNGRSSSGKPLPSGEYLLRVMLEENKSGHQQVKTKKLLYIR